MTSTLLAGRFDVSHQAGAGGMGVVYKATDTQTGATVAIKVLRRTGSRDTARFEREARLLAELDHPSIVRYLNHGITADGSPYLAMEWLEGEDLAASIHNGKLTTVEGLRVVASVARALEVAHRRGIVHRDVKPSNVFLMDGDPARVKVLDFGLAREQVPGEALTAVGVAIGTPSYMAPEQARGARDTDARADVFALGCLLYEVLVGHPAFTGATQLAILLKVLLEEAPRLRDARPDLPQTLCDLFEKMVCKEPALRPASAMLVAEALESIRLTDTRARRPTTEDYAIAGRGLVSVILTRDQPTLEAGSAPGRSALDLLRAALDPSQAVVEQLADGTVVAMLQGNGEAAALTAEVARQALAGHGAGQPMVLASGRMDGVGRAGAVAQVLDRAVNLLDQAAPSGRNEHRVRVDETTAGLLDARFNLGGDAIGLWLKGARTSQVTRTILGRPAPWLGRDEELALLHRLLETCAADMEPVAVLITGEPGVGKTCLAEAFLDDLSAGERHVHVWQVRADESGRSSAGSLAARLLRTLAGVHDDEPLAVQHRKLRARLSRNVPPAEVDQICDFLSELAWAPLPDTDRLALSTARREHKLMTMQIERAWLRLLHAECGDGPLLIWVDDLHLGDPWSLHLLNGALRRLSGKPLLLLGTLELEHGVDKLAVRPTRLHLEPLPLAASRSLAAALLGPNARTSQIEMLSQHGQGNPLLQEEYLRFRSEQPGTEPPPTLLQSIQARAKALSPALRRVLRAASVFGRACTVSGLRALLGDVDDQRLVKVAKRLVEGGWLVRAPTVRLSEGEELLFSHPLLQSAVYALVTPEDRAFGHRNAARWLGQVGETDPVVRARHSERGGLLDEAAVHWLAAAKRALSGCEWTLAAQHAVQGRVAGATDEALGSLRLVEALAAFALDDLVTARAAVDLALRLLPPRQGEGLKARTLALALAVHEADSVALTYLAEPLQTLQPSEAALPQFARCVCQAAQGLVISGDAASAGVLIAKLERSRVAALQEEPMVQAWLELARGRWAQYLGGDPTHHLNAARAAVAAFVKAGDLRNVIVARVEVGVALRELGQLSEARSRLRDALDEAEHRRMTNLVAHARQHLGWTMALQGDLGRAAALARTAAAFWPDGGGPAAGPAWTTLARVELAAQHAQGAVLTIGRALNLLVRREPPHRAAALAVHAEAELALGHREAARAIAARLAPLLQRPGSIGEHDGYARRTLAEVLFAASDHAGGRAALRDARDRVLYRAQFIDDVARRAAFLRELPDHARTLQLTAQWLPEGHSSPT